MSSNLTPEERARDLIDQQLRQAGWSVVDRDAIDLVSYQGVAVREVIMAADAGRADYILYVNRAMVGVIEAKPQGKTLSDVEWQSRRYARGLTDSQRLSARLKDDELPFIYEANGSEIHFTNLFDPEPRARSIFNFQKPEALARILRDAEVSTLPTWRGKVQSLPSVDHYDLRPASRRAVISIEKSLAANQHSRSLVQMVD